MKSINMQSFYPEDLKITTIENTDSQIIISMKSQKHQHHCSECEVEMSNYHGTYYRTVQDLPILGKHVMLKITSYEYICSNELCTQKVFVEDYDGFLSKYSRMTTRCEDFVRMLALETSCEGASLICGHMGINISGDTIIRMLKKMADTTISEKCSDTIGVDDFAYRKGHTYCTIICDGISHKPVAVLDGRDGESLRNWLKQNKHVKRVTRDSASAYAKVLTEELPNAMQIADRFHLHHNLLNAIKEALSREIPNKVAIPNVKLDCKSTDTEKMPRNVEVKKKSR